VLNIKAGGAWKMLPMLGAVITLSDFVFLSGITESSPHQKHLRFYNVPIGALPLSTGVSQGLRAT
jgi:hypothetical protein